jgi:mRNA interferase RelE/StbE
VTYALRIKASAAKELEAIDGAPTRRKIVDAIQSLASEPRPPACKKLAGRDAAYRLRVGDYRIVYTVSDREIVVEIIKIGHRREVYRG